MRTFEVERDPGARFDALESATVLDPIARGGGVTEGGATLEGEGVPHEGVVNHRLQHARKRLEN